jgi:hypothetical protein
MKQMILVYLCICCCVFKAVDIFGFEYTKRALGCFVAFRLDLDVICCRGRFDLSWVRVFIDVPIANDAEVFLRDRVLVLRGVGTWHDDVVVIFVAMDAGSDGMVRVFEDSLDDVDALFVEKIPIGLMLCTCRALSVDNPMTFRKRRCCGCISFFALVNADASKGAP